MKMKKILSVLLSAILILSSVFPMLSFAASTGTYKVIVDTATVYEEPDLLSAKVGEVYSGTFVEVTEIVRGYGRIFIFSAGISGWVSLSALSVPPEEQTTDITGLSVTKPTKLTYIEDEEELDLTGMKVYAVHKDGTKTKITGYQVYSDSFSTYGTKKVRITYTPKGTSVTFSTSFSVTVNRVPLSSLSIKTKPYKVDYIEHNKLDLTGLSVSAKYSDGRSSKTFSLDKILSDPDFTIKGCHGEKNGSTLEAGQHKLTISYKYSDISTTLTINAAPRTLTDIRMTTPPKSTVTYSKTKAPSIKGLTLEATYDNGETEEIPYTECTVNCDPAGFVLGEGNPVYVSYGDFMVTIFYRLALNETTGIRVIPPKKLSYIMGEKIDLKSVRVELMYADGTLEDVTGFTLSEFDPYLSGSQNIIVRYGEYSDVFTISITPHYQKGDADGNGAVETQDARIALRASLDLVKLTGLAFTAADADNDGVITPADARLILRAAVDLEKLI